MKQYLELGVTPYDEDCVQVRSGTDYYPAMKAECEKYRELLGKRFPQLTEFQCSLGIKSFPHDFGSYCEVVVIYNDCDEKSGQYAFWVEDNLPRNWIDIGIKGDFVFTSGSDDIWEDDEVNQEA